MVWSNEESEELQENFDKILNQIKELKSPFLSNTRGLKCKIKTILVV